MSNGRTKIALLIKMCNGWGYMQKKYIQELGATAAYYLRLKESLKGSGKRKITADSWLGLAKATTDTMT